MKETTVPPAFGTSGAAIEAVETIYAKCVRLEMSPHPITTSKPTAIMGFIDQLKVERHNWQEIAREYSISAAYYKDLLVKIGEHFGDDAKRQLDGNIVPDVLVLNIEPLVAGMIAQNKLLLKQNSILIGRNHELEESRSKDQKS